MRTTLSLDLAFPRRAASLVDGHEKTTLASLGFETFIVRESARLPAELGGTEPWVRARSPAAIGRDGLILLETSICIERLRPD